MARYNANGTLDTTFGTTGIVFTNLSSDQDLANSVGIQSDGKIVVVGSQRVVTATSAYYQAEIIRYNMNGSLDSTFGSGGSVLNASVAGAGPLIIQSDGKLLVGAGNAGLSMARFLPSGQLDTSFGTNGVVSGYVPPGISGCGTINVLLKSDGTIFDIGRSGYATLTMAHFSSTGQLDPTFGNGGWVVDSNLGFAGPAAFASNGDLLVAGTDQILYPAHFAAEAFLPSGALDTSFGTNGRVTTSFGSTDDGIKSMVVQSDGRIVAGGYSGGTGSVPYRFALARYMPPPPVIGSFTASPNPVSASSTTTLTVSNLTDPNAGGSIIQVAIYLDSNGDGALEPGSDTLVGYATQTSPGVWTLNYTVNLTPGTYTLFAQAKDNYSLFSDPFALSLTVQ